MNIIVTGKVGIGKTTVCEKVMKIGRSLGYSCGGILTYKALDKGIAVVDIQTGEKEALASINNIYQGPRAGKYFFNPAGIEFGIRAIERGVSSDIVCVDEIGYLELSGGGFVNILELIKRRMVRSSILVIRKELLSAFLSQFSSGLLIIETNIDNRNELPQTISSWLTGNLRVVSSTEEGCRKRRSCENDNTIDSLGRSN